MDQFVSYILQLAAARISAGQARRALAETLSVAPSLFAADAATMTSELVTNAVVHTGLAFELSVRFDPATMFLRVAVDDQSVALPVLRPVAHGQIGGLGMRIIDQASTRWGITPKLRLASRCGSSSGHEEPTRASPGQVCV